jgi:hypothetical protein
VRSIRASHWTVVEATPAHEVTMARWDEPVTAAPVAKKPSTVKRR